MSRKVAAIGLLGLVVALMPVCSSTMRTDGQQKQLGNGKVWSWTEQDKSGNVVRLGVTMSQKAMSNLPGSYDQVEVPLPDKSPVAPYTTVVVFWDPLGHNPAAYSVPHFDFQFYFVKPEELSGISPGSDTMQVPARFRPPDYNAAMNEPSVGTHWGDTTAAEFHGKPFTATFVYGYQNGQMIFIEPMVAFSFMGKEPSFSGFVKQPAAFEQPGSYPTRYTVKYNSRDSTVTIALEGLTVIKAQ